MTSLEEAYESHPLGHQLREALERNEFLLYYQPKLDLVSGKIRGVEALIRWNHPEIGIVSPIEFISAAEETELILPIGEWVLRTACEQNREWMEAGFPSVVMAVNLSVRQLYQPNLIQIIQRILEETGISPEYLEIEITESMMMNVQKVLPILHELKGIGIRISLDDFGTGYSSLYHLKEFPIDNIKIDQCFVRNCTEDEKDATIVKTIIGMAHQLKLEVIAEGIESKDHLIFLQQNLCNKGQGYLFSKPVPPEELTAYFTKIERIIKRVGVPQKVKREKWLEEELENAHRDLKDTLRLQQGMIFKFTYKSGKFIHTWCDGELLYRMGHTFEKVVGKGLHDFLPRDEVKEKLNHYQRAWQGEEDVTYEREENGIWYLTTLRPVRRGGQVVEVIGSCVDITKRKESEERYQQVVQYSPKGIVIHREGTILYANPAAMAILMTDELIGKPISLFIHPDDYNLSQQRLAKFEIGNKLPLIDMRLIRLDSEVIEAEMESVAIPYHGGVATLTIFSDRTYRVKAEETFS